MQILLKLLAPIMALSVLPAYSYSETVEHAEKTQANTIEAISIDRQQELTYMVQQDCGSCHGMTLKGGLGPSLLPERVSVLPKQYLINAVTHGRQGTPMPPWGPLLKQNEIEWIVEQLQLGQLGQKH